MKFRCFLLFVILISPAALFAQHKKVDYSFFIMGKIENYSDSVWPIYKTGFFKDENGKDVRLSDYKGKVICLDFWGMGCAPCRYDINNYLPLLHKKYQSKDMVFINICVDADRDTWKKIIKEVNLDGINLLAEGWVDNEVCKDYFIKGVPHYILINKSGEIAEYNLPRPYELVNEKQNIIDKTLTED